MKLNTKKELAAKTLNVGKSRIIFNTTRLVDIKEAITKQDIRDLFSDKAISLREIKGKKTKIKRKTRRRTGSIKKNVNKGKEKYMALTRKLRTYIFSLRKQEKIPQEKYLSLRKEIRASLYRSKAHLKEKLMGEI
jgi:ribosomal protein L19E